MLEAIDETVDPCDDFYKFSCGNWEKKNVIPDDKSSYGRFQELADKTDIKLKGMKLASVIWCFLP